MKRSLAGAVRHIRAIALLGCSIFAGSSTLAADKVPAPVRPNIVLLICDDADYEDFGFMGSPRQTTPTLDALAKAGTVFTTAHVPAPLCRPSLASLLSGRLPHQHGIYCNYLERPGIGADSIKLSPRGSLANQLKDAGYATYATAKYWEGNPREMGFTHGTIDVTFPGFSRFVRRGQQELFRFIDETHENQPMFIWWAPLLPHTPHNPPPRLAERFANTPVPIPPFVRGDKQKYVAAMRKFYAMQAWFDEGVAELIEKLKATGEYENTLFVFYVDNGWTIGTPAKNSPAEKGLRTPMFVTWPGHVPAGRRIDSLARALDLHATILDYAGVHPAEGIESRTLRPQIDAKNETSPEALFGAVYAHAAADYKGTLPRSAGRDVFALYARTPRWKYVRYTQDIGPANERYIWIIHEQSPMPKHRRGEENLFDLENDPYEMNNLAAQPDQEVRLAELRTATQKWWQSVDGPALPELKP